MQLSIHARAHVASHARLQDAAGQHGQTQTRPDTSFGVGARTNARALRAHSCPLTYSLAHTPRCTLGSGGSPDRRGSRRGSISLSGPCDEQRSGQARMARRHVTVAVFTLAHQPGIELHVPFTRSSPGTICGRATYWYSRLDAGTTKSMLASRVKEKIPQLSKKQKKKQGGGPGRHLPSTGHGI